MLVTIGKHDLCANFAVNLDKINIRLIYHQFIVISQQEILIKIKKQTHDKSF